TKTKGEDDIHDNDRRKREDAKQNDHDEVKRQRDGKVEEHEREQTADRGDQQQHDRERQDLSAEERVAAAGQGDEAVQRVVFELAIERPHRREDRRERERQP